MSEHVCDVHDRVKMIAGAATWCVMFAMMLIGRYKTRPKKAPRVRLPKATLVQR